jgi:hypothetical protein
MWLHPQPLQGSNELAPFSSLQQCMHTQISNTSCPKL